MKKFEITPRIGGDSELGREKRHLGGYGGRKSSGGRGRWSGVAGEGLMDRLRSGYDWLTKPLDEHGPSQKLIEQAGEAGVRSAGLTGNANWRQADRDKALAAVTNQVHALLPSENAPEVARKWLSEYVRREGITFE